MEHADILLVDDAPTMAHIIGRIVADVGRLRFASAATMPCGSRRRRFRT